MEDKINKIMMEIDSLIKGYKAECRLLQKKCRRLYRSYKVSVGWTTKYRNALRIANQRLVDAGLEPINIIKHEEKDIVETIDDTIQDTLF